MLCSSIDNEFHDIILCYNVTYCHQKGVNKYGNSRHLYVLAHKSTTYDGGSVGGKGELIIEQRAQNSKSLTVTIVTL